MPDTPQHSSPLTTTFESEAREANIIKYNVPLPGAHTGRRIVELDLGLEDADFLSAAKEAGEDILEAAGVSKTTGDNKDRGIDQVKLVDFFAAHYSHTVPSGITSLLRNHAAKSESVDELVSIVNSTQTSGTVLTDEDGNPVGASAGEVSDDLSAFRVRGLNDAEAIALFMEYAQQAKKGIIKTPARTWSGKATTENRLALPPEPGLFLVEYIGISSFRGDYGMGKTVRTFTLLPGESTTIHIKTWQKSSESRKEASSIIDSHEESARERFADKIQEETTDKATKSKTKKWHAEAEASASWGIEAKVSGGGSGEHHAGREQFARKAADATQEHASEASAKRELSVSSESEVSIEEGSETAVEREIRNINLRRVLNFVFRELNQEYTTKIHLKDIRVGFTNGQLNSWREVSLSRLLPLLREVLVTEKVDITAQKILEVAGMVVDHEDNVIPTLDQVRFEDGAEGLAAKVDGSPKRNPETKLYKPPTDDMYYRFKRGPLGQEASGQADEGPHYVDGVILAQRDITMKTDSVVVEALVGQADALDDYAMEIQQAAARKQTLDNERDALLLSTLRDISDPVQRAELASRLFGTQTTSEPQP